MTIRREQIIRGIGAGCKSITAYNESYSRVIFCHPIIKRKMEEMLLLYSSNSLLLSENEKKDKEAIERMSYMALCLYYEVGVTYIEITKESGIYFKMDYNKVLHSILS